MTRRSLSLSSLAAIAVLVAACGGSTASPAATGAASPSAAASSVPSEAASPSAAASQAAVSPGASPDLAALFGNATQLDSLTSYQISMSTQQKAGPTTIDITSVRKPVDSARYDISTPDGKKISVVKVGNDGWVSQDGTTFIKTPAAALTSVLGLFTPESLFAAFQKNQDFLKSFALVGTEQKNGVQATHYHVDSSTPLPPGATETIPPGASADVWISEDGYLVALEGTNVSEDMSGVNVEVTHINDPALKVEAPA